MNENSKHFYKKEFGQHFLFNPQIHEKIIGFVEKEINMCEEDKPINVLEIGPGAGHLSRAILEKLQPKRLIMIEKDVDLEDHLMKSFNLIKQNENSEIKLFFDDALKFNFEKFLLDEIKINPEKEKLCLIANLPYNIATKLLLNFFEIQSKHNLFDIITVLIQKEVAERFASSCSSSSKNYGKTGILSNLLFKKTIVHFHIGPKNFTPPPKVDSSLISFVKKKNFDESRLDFPEFMGFLNSAFCFPRKMLINNLKNFKGINASKLEKIFDLIEISKSSRPSELSPKKYLELFEKIQNSEIFLD